MLCICIGLQNNLIWRECEVIGGQSNQDDRQHNTIVPIMVMKMMMRLIIKMMMMTYKNNYDRQYNVTMRQLFLLDGEPISSST